MHVVLEEIENNIACLIPDDKSDPIYVPVTVLPSPYEIGDVFVMTIREDDKCVIKKDSAEKEQRLSDSRMKRERLLKRSSENYRNKEEN